MINQALRDAAKDAIRASSYYDSNPYAAESTNKVIDESRIGANFIIMVNKCPTFGGFSAACGGICPPGKKLTDCASGRVFTALAQCLDSPSDYTWGSDNLGVLGENGRMACLLPPPPLGHYSSCPDATTIELSTLTHFYTILVSMLRIGGCNLLLLCCAGITSNFYKELISTVEVDDYFVKELLSKIDRDVVPPMNGQLVKCGEESTRHLKCFTVFTSTSVDRQLSQMCQSVASIADCVEELAGPEHADEFTALAYKHEDLRFVTSSTTEIQALKTEYGHVEAAIAKKAETRKQEKAALLAARTEAEIEQEERKKAESKLAANAIRRARHANRTADEKEQAMLKKRASEQARQANMTADETVQARQGTNRTFEEQVDRLAAYKDKYGNCHVPRKYKDDTVLATWVDKVRQGITKLSEEQKQILDAMGFAWDIDEINASKRQQMILEVCLIVILLSLSRKFTNNLSYSDK